MNISRSVIDWCLIRC